MLTGNSSIGKPGARDEVHGNGELTLSGIEVNALNVPGRGYTESGFEQLIRHVALSCVAGCRILPQPAMAQLIVQCASRVRFAGLTPALDSPNRPTQNSKEAVFSNRLLISTTLGVIMGINAASRR
jgi:hypothetical protein